MNTETPYVCTHSPSLLAAILHDECPLCTRERLTAALGTLSVQVSETKMWRAKYEALDTFLKGLVMESRKLQEN